MMGFISKARVAKTVYAGSTCTGTDGDTGRTLTHTKGLGNDSLVIIGRATLLYGASNDYTVSGSVITFNLAVDNTDVIMVLA